MAFTTIDKRLVARKDLAFQEKYIKDTARHAPDAADEYETVEIEHEPIGLYQKKKGAGLKDSPEAAPKAAG